MPTVDHTACSGKAGKAMPVPSSRSLNCHITQRHLRQAIPQSLRNLLKNPGMHGFLK